MVYAAPLAARPGFPQGSREKADGKPPGGELAHLGRLDGCLRSVHQRYSVPISTGARCLLISYTLFAGWGRGVEHPSLGAWGRKAPTGTPCRDSKAEAPDAPPCVTSRYFASMSHTLRTRRFFASPRRQRTRFSPGSMEKKLSLRSISASSLSMQTLPA